jgi:predicted HAD superfamily hydrolase
VERWYTSTVGPLAFRFRSVRVESERLARERAWTQSGRTETTLDEIYQCMQEVFGVAHETAIALKDLEVATELQGCTRNDEIHAIYRYCLETMRPVLFVSDMYLPSEVVRQILCRCGYEQFQHLFVSSALGATKSSGDLYEYMLKELACRPQEILHIGDHYDSDVIMAGRYGLVTYRYEKCGERMRRLDHHRRHRLQRCASSGAGEGSVEASIYVATILRCLLVNGPTRHEGSDDPFWYEFGYICAGPLFFGFVSWLLACAVKDQVETLYFLSRDGQILKRIYDQLSSRVEHAPPSEYLYASRRALNVPAITELDERTVDFLVSGTSILRVAQFLERLSLDPRLFTRAIREAGFSSMDQRVRTGADYAKLRSLFRSITDEISRVAVEERSVILDYFRGAGMFDRKRIGIVDIGWHGTLQNSISTLLGLTGRRAEIKGYYLGTFSTAKAAHDRGQEMAAYLCEYGKPESRHTVIKLCVELFEFLHLAPHGSVLRFTARNGDIAPVLEENDFERPKMAKACAVQRGVLDFVKDFEAAWQQFYFLSIPPDLALQPISEVLRDPTKTEAAMLGDLEHAEGFGNVYERRYIAKPPGLLTAVMNPRSLFDRYRQAFWKIGYMKRLLSFDGLVGD